MIYVPSGLKAALFMGPLCQRSVATGRFGFFLHCQTGVVPSSYAAARSVPLGLKATPCTVSGILEFGLMCPPRDANSVAECFFHCQICIIPSLCPVTISIPSELKVTLLTGLLL